jgi:hypothetical protein
MLVGKYELKELLGIVRRRFRDNIKMYVRETGCATVDRIE